MAIPGFIETPHLPDEFTFWASGGRAWKTTIVETYGGEEYRNQAFTRSKGVWSMQEALRSTNPLSSFYIGTVTKYARIGRGMLAGMRFRDWQDFRGDDAGGSGIWSVVDATHWQMQKYYLLDGLDYTQIIKKPRVPEGTYIGITWTGNTGGVLDYSTGILAGGTGTPLTWAGCYDVPVRFDSDIPDVGMLGDGTYYNWNDLRFVELKNLT